MSYILQVTTESYLLTGSGEGATLIDADVVFHPSGFPMIPARRVKGMLKESLEEVLEIFGKTRMEIDEMVSSLFGDPGVPTFRGKLLFHNLMLQEWKQIAEEIKNIPKEGALEPEFVKSYFTTEVQQTAIGKEGNKDEIDGVAKSRSLRNYRVIKPGKTFESQLGITAALTPEEDQFLQKAVLNLRHAGTRRNRGFGKIKCQLLPDEVDNTTLTRQGSSSEELPARISVSVTTLAPVILAELQGEQNTVFTRKFISGNQLRGLLANAYMRSQGLTFQNAHLDPGFQELFLSGKLKFGNLRFNQGQAIPLHLHEYKRDPNKNPISVFSKDDKDKDITKPIKKRIGQIKDGAIQTSGFSPKTTFNFHNSRPNRAAGRNTELDEEGGIFYYESLDEGQTFHGEITGDTVSLKKLLDAFPSSFQARLGRSRSAQYGLSEVSLKGENKINKVDAKPAVEYILTLESPLILLNEWGFPSPTVEDLKKELLKAWGVEIEVKNAAAAFTQVEQFNAVWRSKSGLVPAFKEGTSFLIEVPVEVKEAPESLGEWTEQGFGRIKVECFVKDQVYRLDDDKNPGETKSKDKPNLTTKVLRDLQAAFDIEQIERQIKKKALEAAKLSKRPNNHLICRLERLFERSTSTHDIVKWIDETRGKPAGDALKNTNLVDYDHNFDFKIDAPWQQQRLYWITFFQTLRKLNKKDGKKQ